MRKFLDNARDAIISFFENVFPCILICLCAAVFIATIFYSVLELYHSKTEKPVVILSFYQEEHSVDGREQASLYYYVDGFAEFIAFDNPANTAEFIRLLGEKYRVVNLSAYRGKEE